MQRALMLLVLVLAVPLVLFGAAIAVQTRLDLAHRGRLGTTGPGLTAACIGGPSSPPACDAYAAAGLIEQAAAVTAVIGVTLLVAIAILGYAARFNRVILLVGFTIGLPLTNVILLGLLLTQGLMVVGGLYLAQSVLVGSVFPLLTVAAGIGAGVGMLALLRSMLTAVGRQEVEIVGLGLEKEGRESLWALIKEISTTLGVSPPRYVIAGLDPTFFVTDAPVQCLNGRSNGRILFLSLPLCRILTQGELAAVIGHELGHFRGGDLWFSRHFYPIYQGTQRSLAALNASADDLLQAIPLFPSLAIMSLFFDAFGRAESKISRDRELAADRCGVAAGGAGDLAAALVKLTAFAKEWDRGQMVIERQVRLSRVTVHNVSAAFAENVRAVDSSTTLDRLADDPVAHPMDSHPPLGVRLAALNLAVDDVRGALADTAPSAPAIDLIGGHEALEDELSEGLFRKLQEAR